MNITSYINWLVEIYVEKYELDSVADINGGYCGDFADELVTAFKHERIAMCGLTHDLWFIHSMAGHFWVKYQDRYYDAESPDGVVDWRDLMIYQRQRQNHPYKEIWQLPVSELPDCTEYEMEHGQQCNATKHNDGSTPFELPTQMAVSNTSGT